MATLNTSRQVPMVYDRVAGGHLMYKFQTDVPCKVVAYRVTNWGPRIKYEHTLKKGEEMSMAFHMEFLGLVAEHPPQIMLEVKYEIEMKPVVYAENEYHL